MKSRAARALLLLVLSAAAAFAGPISTSSVNGEAVVTWNGTIVWQGRTVNPLRAAAVVIDGREFAAAFDGEKTLWESEAGGAAKVRDKSPELRASAVPPKGPVAGRGISTRIVDGITIIQWQGKEVWRGTTSGFLVCRSKAFDGVELAAAFDGDKVVWESQPGVAARVK